MMAVTNFMRNAYDLSYCAVGFYKKGRWIKADSGNYEDCFNRAIELESKDVSAFFRDRNGVDLCLNQFLAALGSNRRAAIVRRRLA